MSWTRLDDMWTESTELEALTFAERWHYLTMIQHCSRTRKFDGNMRMVDARRCSDHPDPDEAINSLAGAGLVQVLGPTVKVLQIDGHIPPPSVRNKQEDDRKRKQRQRKHKEGDHSMCVPEYCEASLPPVTSEVTRDKGSDPRTGQDRTGRDIEIPHSVEEVDPETGEIASDPSTSTADPSAQLEAVWNDAVALLEVAQTLPAGDPQKQSAQERYRELTNRGPASHSAPGPAELFGDAPVEYTPSSYDAGHWNEPAPIPAFAKPREG